MAARADGGDEWADRFLAAALEPPLWDDALGAMAAATGSRRGQLVGFGPDSAIFNRITDIDPGLLDRSDVQALHRPELNFRLMADAMAGGDDIVHEAHYDIARQRIGNSDYLDLCAELDIADGCHARLMVEDGAMIGLALLRGRKDGRTSQEQRDLFARLAGHARIAVRLQRAIEQQGFALLNGTFEAMDRACWLLDWGGRVRAMTPRAEALLLAGSARVSDGWLCSGRAEESRAILRGIRAVVARPAQPAPPVLLEQGEGPALLLEFHPLPARDWAMAFAPRALVVGRKAPSTAYQAHMLMEGYKLTPAEADIAVRLASGMSRPHIAAARGVSAGTLKAQLRNIYEKTGCTRESQLVRMVSLLYM
ncbi:helix-turn-helix transcriptional regulator [Sphingobium cloacae]|uniref:DNA-binding protein with HTH domain-containing protein n=1 Tax=Sphingobium cloacae TaxID=120107 RepID=A0A1E1F3A7_9SPHN|nr:helix-turn-helix transcriptional regulator [Sphingobium cloacae]BAV64995.1 DNA-binding protein with HTH domain-containing protein [Sphingobium cloacae]